MNDFENSETELMLNGIKFLSDNIRFRETNTQYSINQNRVIRRTLDCIQRTKENCQALHDFLVSQKLAPDVFDVFFKIWSAEYNNQNPKIREEVNK